MFRRLSSVKFLKRFAYLTYQLKASHIFPLPDLCSHTTNDHLIATARLGYTDARDNAIRCDD